MMTDKRSDYTTRDSILKLLSNDEVARVSTAEMAVHLGEGDEYLDLEQLGRGVRRAHASDQPMASVLPRKAVLPETWSRILTELEAPRL